MNKMLISATQPDEVRVALVKDKLLHDLDVEHPGFEQKKANIYKARVSRIEPSLEAAFVEYGSDRHGFLPFKEIARSYFKESASEESFSKLAIKDALTEGQEIIVQIDKEERGTKGAALTTFISLAGSYLVLMPNNPRVGGISRRVEGKEREELRENIRSLNLPEGMGLIVRTAGVGKSVDELKWDMDALMRQWLAIEEASTQQSAPFLIHQEGDTVMRAIRDHLRQDTVEILVDQPELFEKTKQYIQQVKPDFIDRVKLYEDKTPLFSFHQIEQQIETAYQRTVTLPSGGAIVIDNTEALISIDVNSAKATGGSGIEETAFNTNREAAQEIARQLRIRDLGGLIVIDFIDMSHSKNQRDIAIFLRKALEGDRARVQVGHITRFGLMEMSRQRLRSTLGKEAQVPCPRCDGQGTIRSIESLATSVMRLIEEEAVKDKTSEIHVQLPIDFATFLLNEKRDLLTQISQRHGVKVIVLPNQHLETPHYRITRVRNHESSKKCDASYKMIDALDTQMPKKQETPVRKTETPAVGAAVKSSETGLGLFATIKKIFSSIFGKKKPEVKTQTRPYRSSGSRQPYKRRPQTNRSRTRRDHQGKPGERTNANPNRRRNPSANRSRANPAAARSEAVNTPATDASTQTQTPVASPVPEKNVSAPSAPMPVQNAPVENKQPENFAKPVTQQPQEQTYSGKTPEKPKSQETGGQSSS